MRVAREQLQSYIPPVYTSYMDQISKKISLLMDEVQDVISDVEKEISKDYWLLGNSLMELRGLRMRDDS